MVRLRVKTVNMKMKKELKKMIGKPFYKLNDEVTFVMDIDGEKDF